MSIEIRSKVAIPQEHLQDQPLPVLRQTFQSRGADFVIETSNHAWIDNHAVTLRVGPIGLDIRANEAEALGKALIAASEHYCRAAG